MSSLKVNAKIIAYLLKRRAKRWLLRRSWRKEPEAINGPMGVIGRSLLVFLMLYGFAAVGYFFYQLSLDWHFWYTF